MRYLLFLSAMIAGALPAAVVDGLAAKVNADAITVGEVMNELRRDPEAEERLRSATGNDDIKGLYDAALDQLIDRKLILALAADKKMEMQEWVVDNRVREIVKDNFEGDRTKLEAELTRRRIPFAEWRNVIREDMILMAMRFQYVEKYATPSPAEMRREWSEHKADYNLKPSVTVSVILLKPGDDTAGAVSTRGDEIIERIDAGESFADLARRHSADSHAKDGGLWKDVDPAESFRPEIAEAIAALKVGEHSKLVNLDGWGFIVRKESEVLGGERTFAQAARDVERRLSARKAREIYGAWTKRLRADSFVKRFPMPEEQ